MRQTGGARMRCRDLSLRLIGEMRLFSVQSFSDVVMDAFLGTDYHVRILYRSVDAAGLTLGSSFTEENPQRADETN